MPTMVGAATPPPKIGTWRRAIASQVRRLDGLPVRRVYDPGLPPVFSRSHLRHDHGHRWQVWSFKPGDAPPGRIERLLASVPDPSRVYVVPHHEPVDDMGPDDYRALYLRVKEAYDAVGGFAGIGPCLTAWSINHRGALEYAREDVSFLGVDVYPELDAALNVAPVDWLADALRFCSERGAELVLGEFAVDRTNKRHREEQTKWLRGLAKLADSVPVGPMCYFDVDWPDGKWRLAPGELLDTYSELRERLTRTG